MSKYFSNSMKTKALLGAAGAVGLAATLALVGPANAEEGQKRGAERHKAMMEKVDTNQDGKISREEADAARKARFDAVDANNDGTVTFEEMERAREQRQVNRRKRHFDRMDANDDGVLSPDEMDHGGKRFEKMDLNGDGEITAEERQQARKKMRHHRRHKHQHGGPAPEGGANE